MSPQGKRRGIVVGVDGSPPSTAAVCWAAHDAALRNLPLDLVHLMNPVAIGRPMIHQPEGFTVWQENEGHRILADALKIARDAAKDHPRMRVEGELMFSATVPALLDLSKEAELVVAGSYGRGALGRGLTGSVSASLVRQAHCPVAIIRDEDSRMPDPEHAPILVGIDGSPASDLAIAIAFDEASRRRVNLVAMHAWSDTEILELPGLDWSAVKDEEERILAEGLAGWHERYPDVTVHRLLVCDRPARALVDISESAQLVVVGSHGRGRFTGTLLGSVGNAVVQAVHVPVIVARPSQD